MTEPIIELVVVGTTKVVAVACGTCRMVRLDRTTAAECCLPKLCPECGEKCEQRGWLFCDACRERMRIAKEQALYDKAVKVPAAEYEYDVVCTSPFGDSYLDVSMWSDEGLEDERCWACAPLPWPKFDATDIIDSLLGDEFPEDAHEHLDVATLQAVLDAWLAAQGESTFWMADTKRAVVFSLPSCDGEEMMPVEEVSVEDVEASP